MSMKPEVDHDPTVKTFTNWLAEMKVQNHRTVQEILSETSIIRDSITANNMELTDFKRHSSSISQQMQSQLTDLREKLTTAFGEITALVKQKTQSDSEMMQDTGSPRGTDVNTLQQNLSQKTYELEALKKSYSQAHQHLQSSLIQMQNHLQVSKAEVSTAKTTCERVRFRKKGKRIPKGEGKQGLRAKKAKKKNAEDHRPSLHEWLEQRAEGLGNLELRDLPGATQRIPFLSAELNLEFSTLNRYCLCLTRDVPAGKVIFSVPEQHLLSGQKALEDEVVHAAHKRLEKLNVEEPQGFLLCLRLCRAHALHHDSFHPMAVDAEHSTHGALGWPEAFQQMLASTSLKEDMEKAEEQLRNWEAAKQALQELDLKCDLKSLRWARDFWWASAPADTILPWYHLLVSSSPANISMAEHYRLAQAWRGCLKLLPKALNFTVCKGPLQRRRKEYLETFLEGQLAIVQSTLEQMQDADAADGAEADEAGEDQQEDVEEEDEQEDWTFEDVLAIPFQEARDK
eukprot:g19853.t1